jgi:general secretion pathway protein D
LRFITQTNDMAQVSEAVRNYFFALGVDLTPGTGKSLFWNDRVGKLIVRATQQDLDIIQSAIEVLNEAPPLVNIRAKFAEVTQNDSRGIGFDWYLGNVLMAGGRMGMQGGTAPSYNGTPTAANPGGTFPGGVAAPSLAFPGGFNTLLPPGSSDSVVSSGLRNAANVPAVMTFSGILTDPQFRVVMRMMEQRDGADLLAAPEVTTLSGRQAQVQMVDLKTVVTGTSLNQGNQGGQQTTASGGGTVQQANAPVFNQPLTEVMSFGPVLDVLPTVSADGYSIQMTILPTITEFVGYDDPGQFVPQAIAGGGQTLTSVLPLPHFRVRQVTTTAIVWDGQTIVLGGLISESVTKFRDKVPVLGDLPWLGRFFRSESDVSQRKNLVVFVTPTLIDPAGNRLHSDEEMPFAQTSLPAQPRSDQ